MLSVLAHLACRVHARIARAVRDRALLLDAHRRRLWGWHRDKVANDPGYAAVAGAVVAGLLGLPAGREVWAVVFAAVVGVYLRSNGPGDPSHRPWPDPSLA